VKENDAPFPTDYLQVPGKMFFLLFSVFASPITTSRVKDLLGSHCTKTSCLALVNNFTGGSRIIPS